MRIFFFPCPFFLVNEPFFEMEAGQSALFFLVGGPPPPFRLGVCSRAPTSVRGPVILLPSLQPQGPFFSWVGRVISPFPAWPPDKTASLAKLWTGLRIFFSPFPSPGIPSYRPGPGSFDAFSFPSMMVDDLFVCFSSDVHADHLSLRIDITPLFF